MCLIVIGTGLVYPTLLAAISDMAHLRLRATSLGVYRFRRDLGIVFDLLLWVLLYILYTSVAVSFNKSSTFYLEQGFLCS